MVKVNFFDIVNMNSTRVSIPHTSHFTIGTSPYYAHQHGLAIDVYHSLSLENYEVISPISGVVEKVRSLIAPKPKFIGGTDKDYLTLVRNPYDNAIVYKILHVKPRVQVGEHIMVGDPLGTTIRNGYFAYWSSPHLHLEVRPSNNAVRATGGGRGGFCPRCRASRVRTFHCLQRRCRFAKPRRCRRKGCRGFPARNPPRGRSRRGGARVARRRRRR